MGIVADEYCAAAALFADRAAYLAKGALQGVTLFDRGPQRMMWIDAVDRQRGRIQIGAFERPDVIADGLFALQVSVRIDREQDDGNLQ